MANINVLQAAAAFQRWFENFCEHETFNGIKSISTFMQDMTIADFGGDENAIKETYQRVLKEWLGNYKMWIEFVCVLNHKCWMWYDENEGTTDYHKDADGIHHAKNNQISQLYADLYEKARDLFYEKYEGNPEATSYFFEVTD